MAWPLSAPDWSALLREHLGAHPTMRAQDVRKLVHQAVCGPGHAIASPPAAFERLMQEAAMMGDGPATPLVEPIAPHGSMVRVHLRPFIAAGGALAALCRGFVASAAACTGASDHLAPVLEEVTTALLALEPALHAAWVAELPDWRHAGMPAVHHSPAFQSAERPAYRVLTAAEARTVMDTCGVHM